jgi:hypothetical protein
MTAWKDPVDFSFSAFSVSAFFIMRIASLLEVGTGIYTELTERMESSIF